MHTLDPGNSLADKKQFYSWVHSSVVAQIIKNGLSVQGSMQIYFCRRMFQYQDVTLGETKHDGPTTMFLIYQKTNPSTVVGLDSVLKDIEDAKLGNFTNDVDAMLTASESHYKI